MLSYKDTQKGQANQGLTDQVKEAARAVGFDLVGISKVGPATHGAEFREWLNRGNHLPMLNLAQAVEVRTDPRNRHPWAKSVISLGMLYGASGVDEETEQRLLKQGEVAKRPTTPPMPACEGDPNEWQKRDAEKRQRSREIVERSPALGVAPWIARFERNANYHRINDGKLNLLSARLSEIAGRFVQTQNVIEHNSFFERDLGYQSGLGWVGKNNLLINPKLGSFFVFTSIFTDLELEPDTIVTDHCGTCTACLDACPTNALDGPHNIVVERCLSARSISIEGPVPPQYLAVQAGHLSGCDICQDACPFNRKHAGSPHEIAEPPQRWREVSILDLLECDEAGRQILFAGSLVARISLNTLKRNALLIAARILRMASGGEVREAFDETARQVANQDIITLREAVARHLNATDLAVREAAIYAFYQQMPD